MHEHDLDLIMALADGTLDASDVPSAEAKIAACAECSEDLELQRLALRALAAAPPVAMTEMESSRMRRTLRHELGLVPAVPPAKQPRRWFSMGALATAAALLLALVIVGPGLDLLGPGSDDSGEETALFTTTTSAAAERQSVNDGAAVPEAVAEFEGDAAGDGADTTSTAPAPTTTSAPAAETTPTAVPAPAMAMRFAEQPNLTTLREAIINLGITADTDLSQFEDELRALGLTFELAATDPTADTQECLALGVDSIPSAVSGYALGQAPYDGTEVMVAVYETGAPGEIVVAVHDTSTCEVLARRP